MSATPAPGGSIATGQMVCIEWSTRAGRSIRLLGFLAEATEEHLMVEGLEGSATRPGVGDTVSLSTLVGRTVQQASTAVLASSETSSRRLMLRRPLALLEGNRRRHDRVGVHIACEWFEVEAGPGAVRAGQTVDVSVGGVLLLTSGEPVATGERIVLTLVLPGRRVAGIAEVRSWRPEGAGARVGVQFVALAELDRAALAQISM
jgi:PilZ domain-containing protein